MSTGPRKLVAVCGLLLGLLSGLVAWHGYGQLQAMAERGILEEVAVLDRRVDREGLGVSTPRYRVNVDGQPRWLELSGPPQPPLDGTAWLRRLPGQPSSAELYAGRPPDSPWAGSTLRRRFWMALLAAPLFMASGLAIGLGYGPRGLRGALSRHARTTHLGRAHARRAESRMSGAAGDGEDEERSG